MGNAHPVAVQLNTLADELNATFLERRSLTQASILALLTKEHVFALGAPGSAKSLFFRTLAKAFINARYFEIALSKTRPAEAVLGPLDIKAFRENGDYKLKRKGFATTSELIFLDEIGKASPILGHDLLALLNERIYHEVDDEGNSAHPAPLSTAFTGSNEMLTDESDDNAALADRLLFKVLVDYIQDTDNFKAMLTSDMSEPETTIEWTDFKQVVDEVIPAIKISQATLDGVAGLKEAFAREGMSPSDRRWRTSMKALQAQAFLNGRSETNENDLLVLTYTLWDTPQQIEKVERLCKTASNPYYDTILRLKDALNEVEEGIDERVDQPAEVRNHHAIEVTSKLKRANDNITTLRMEAEAAGRDLPADVEAVIRNLDRLMVRNLREMMGMDDDDNIAITKRQLLGRD
ncbi:AAA family ATPase [Nocardioides maradonensis]